MNELPASVQALLAGCFTWALTTLGAALVLLGRNVSRKALDALLGFACGVMLAASYWSLLAPAIEISREGRLPAWFAPAVGILAGALFLRAADRILPHLSRGFAPPQAEGIRTSWHRTTLFVLAITLHNIPEGMAVGVAFGAAAAGLPSATMSAAIALTIGIGLQNFPEGLSVSAVLRREGMGRARSFWYGQLSGAVEPLAAAAGAASAALSRTLLPYALSFAAGAMIFVVLEDAIPEAERAGNTVLAAMSAMVGFVVMMILDVGI